MKPLRSFVCACSLALYAVSLQAATFGDFEYEESESGVTITGYTGSATTLDIPDTINGKPVTAIGEDAFQYRSLTSVTIPDSVTTIGADAFKECRSLTSVTIGNNVTSIGNYAFLYCAFASVTIPDSVTSIGAAAFYGNKSLTSVVIGNKVTSISESAFDQCSNLKSVTIPDSVATIGVRAFFYCTGLTSVKLGNGVTSIGESAFGYCTALPSITIPDGVTTIDGGAFDTCQRLTSVTIPDSITDIASDAFVQCSGLDEVVFTGAPPTYETPSGWTDPWGETTWKYPAAEREAWQAAIASGQFEGQITFKEYTVRFDETVPAADREWLETALEAQGFSGMATLVGDAALLEAFRPLGVLPHFTQEDTTLTLNVELEAAFAALRDAAVAGEIYGKAQLDAKVDEIALTAPLIAVGENDVTVEIGLQTAETLGDWQPATMTTVETSETGTLRVRLPKPTDSTASFYKFVVPDGRQP